MDRNSFSLTRKSTLMLAATWWTASGYQKSSCGDKFSVSHSCFLTRHMLRSESVSYTIEGIEFSEAEVWTLLLVSV